MSTQVTKIDNEIISKLILSGDISKMSGEEKTQYYKKFCESLGLNPLTKPFQILKEKENGFEKEILYATKSCTEQLRKIHGVSIIEIDTKEIKGVYVVTAKAQDKDGRTDVATGVVSLHKSEFKWNEEKRRSLPTGKTIELVGDELANAFMKAETKAKRRVTLSICGLGMLDESEIETIKGAETKDIYEPAQEAVIVPEPSMDQKLKGFVKKENDEPAPTAEHSSQEYTKTKEEYLKFLADNADIFPKSDQTKYAYKDAWTIKNLTAALNALKKLRDERRAILNQEQGQTK